MPQLFPKTADSYANQETELLPHAVSCRITLIINISESKEKLLEEWKYFNDPNTAPFERVEHANRPVIYGIDLDSQETDTSSNASGKSLYKLLLVDDLGQAFYGLEVEELLFLHPPRKSTQTPLPIPLGGTLVLHKGTCISYGLIMLRNNQCSYTVPDQNCQLSQTLNDGLVQKYIEVLDRQLHGKSD